MSDAQQNETRQAKQAVVLIDDRPYLELTAEEWIHPVTLRDGLPVVRFHQSPYLPREVKPWLDDVIGRRKRRTQVESSIETPDYSDAITFVLAHMTAVGNVATEDGADLTLDQMRAWLRDNPPAAVKVWEQAYNIWGPRDRSNQLEAAKSKAARAVLVFGRKETRIPLEIQLYSPERKTDESVRLVCIMERLSESDRHQYDKATAVVENSRRGEVYTDSNWDVIEQLANHKMIALDGALLDGKPCTVENRGDAKTGWARLVPFLAKVYLLGQAVQEIEAKNA